jgi:hypothetical protein
VLELLLPPSKQWNTIPSYLSSGDEERETPIDRWFVSKDRRRNLDLPVEEKLSDKMDLSFFRAD